MTSIAKYIRIGVALIFSFHCPAFASAVNCQTTIEVNDMSAKIEVDGKVVVGVPVIVNCKPTPQVIRITSGDNQVFTRVLPDAENFDWRDSTMNVYFRPQENASMNAGGTITPGVTSNNNLAGGNSVARLDVTHAQLSNNQDSQIMRELRAIRTLLENFIKTHPEMHKPIQDIAQTALRGILVAPSAQVNVPNTVASTKAPAVPIKTKSVEPLQVKNSDLASSDGDSGPSSVLEAVHTSTVSSKTMATKAILPATSVAVNTAGASASGVEKTEATQVNSALPAKSTKARNPQSVTEQEGAVQSAQSKVLSFVAEPFYIRSYRETASTPTVAQRNVSSMNERVGGAFVQLYSLSRKTFDSRQIGRDMNKAYGSDLAGTKLRFCHWQSKKNDSEWTRVLLGPFSSAQLAKEIVKVIGRDTFSVSSPQCEVQTANEIDI